MSRDTLERFRESRSEGGVPSSIVRLELSRLSVEHALVLLAGETGSLLRHTIGWSFINTMAQYVDQSSWGIEVIIRDTPEEDHLRTMIYILIRRRELPDAIFSWFPDFRVTDFRITKEGSSYHLRMTFHEHEKVL